MKKQASEQLKRACEVIKSDRMGISSSIEDIISYEIKKTLSDYFSVYDKVKTEIKVSDNGFIINIKAMAKSVKKLKII